MPHDYYEILGVPRSATQSEIKKSYHRLAKRFHPDVNKGDKKAEEKFKEISQAYDILGDPDKRKKFDQFGQWAEQGGFDPSHQARRNYTWSSGGPSGPGRGGRGPEFDLGDIFENIFGGGGGGFGDVRQGRGFRGESPFQSARGGSQAEPEGRDVHATVEIGFEEAVHGTTRRVSLTRSGREQKIDVKIPAGIRDNGKIRLAGKGERGGDLYFDIKVASHPKFRREEDDIYVEVPISVTEAVLGGTVKVPTLTGTVNLKVPPLTSSGQKFRLAGKGAPHLGKGGHGDQYAVVKIVVPSRLDDETKGLFQKIHERIS